MRDRATASACPRRLRLIRRRPGPQQCEAARQPARKGGRNDGRRTIQRLGPAVRAGHPRHGLVRVLEDRARNRARDAEGRGRPRCRRLRLPQGAHGGAEATPLLPDRQEREGAVRVRDEPGRGFNRSTTCSASASGSARHPASTASRWLRLAARTTTNDRGQPTWTRSRLFSPAPRSERRPTRPIPAASRGSRTCGTGSTARPTGDSSHDFTPEATSMPASASCGRPDPS